jgi:hypothetical protein
MQVSKSRRTRRVDAGDGRGNPSVPTYPFFGGPTKINTTAGSVRIVDNSLDLQMVINRIAGGDVEKKTTKQSVLVPTEGGTFPGPAKMEDAFLIRPVWSDPKAQSQTVSFRISYWPYAGGLPNGRSFEVTFRRAK